jgi:hypothetical protein
MTLGEGLFWGLMALPIVVLLVPSQALVVDYRPSATLMASML